MARSHNHYRSDGGEHAHAELAVLDQLDQHRAAGPGSDLDTSAPDRPRALKPLLVDDSSAAQEMLAELADELRQRVAADDDAGPGEAMLDLGREPDRTWMMLDSTQWTRAVDRVREAARQFGADIRVLITYNVGGPVEAESMAPETGSGSGGDGGNEINSGLSGLPGGTAGRRRPPPGCCGKVLLRQTAPSAESVIERRVAVVGNVDAGKSTLLGVLGGGRLDDGRGGARVRLFRHKHERDSGRTSSVGGEVLGFDAAGEVVGAGGSITGGSGPPSRLRPAATMAAVAGQAAKMVAFVDLAGHERYLRTTVFGLLGTSPDHCLLVVAANNGLVGMAGEHLGLALALGVPVAVALTKVDICPAPVLKQTLAQLARALKAGGAPGVSRKPVLVRGREDAVAAAAQVGAGRACPVFLISNVSGAGLEPLRLFLNLLPPLPRTLRGAAGIVGGTQPTVANPGGGAAADTSTVVASLPLDFSITDPFSVPFVGTVVAGILRAGAVNAGDPVLLGPDSRGRFRATAVKSIERRRVRVGSATAGQAASLALKGVRRTEVRRGMVVLAAPVTVPREREREKDKEKEKDQAPMAAYGFVAEGECSSSHSVPFTTSTSQLTRSSRSPHSLPRHHHSPRLSGNAARWRRQPSRRHCGARSRPRPCRRPRHGGLPVHAAA